ncbi:hypothetical protein [Nonomuraea sp. NPDC049158]|uniref:hypothetical protein n=1 Tax=Nonomuraea sp. NPDC049158 TaxID=3155649 RepID=UPI0034049CB5
MPKEAGMHTLGAWLNAAEVTLAIFPSDDWRDQRQITYAVNVRTGQVRKLAVYRPQAAMHLVLPGAPPAA